MCVCSRSINPIPPINNFFSIIIRCHNRPFPVDLEHNQAAKLPLFFEHNRHGRARSAAEIEARAGRCQFCREWVQQPGEEVSIGGILGRVFM